MTHLRLTPATDFSTPNEANTPTFLLIRPKCFMGSSPISIFASSNDTDHLICSDVVLGKNQSQNILHPALSDFVAINNTLPNISRFTMLSIGQVQATLAVLMCSSLNPCESKIECLSKRRLSSYHALRGTKIYTQPWK